MRPTRTQSYLRRYAEWAGELPGLPSWTESGNYLDCRDVIEEDRTALTPAEEETLRVADKRVREHADLVMRLLPVSPADYRRRNRAPRRWWWRYLDQIAAGTYKEPEQRAA